MLHTTPAIDPNASLRLTIVWTSIEFGAREHFSPPLSKVNNSVFDFKPQSNNPAITQIMGEIELWKSKGYAWLDGQMVTFGQIKGLLINIIT